MGVGVAVTAGSKVAVGVGVAVSLGKVPVTVGVGVGVAVTAGSCVAVAVGVGVTVGVGVASPVGVGVATIGALTVLPKAEALPSVSIVIAVRLAACQAPTMVRLKSPLASAMVLPSKTWPCWPQSAKISTV